MLGLRFVCAPGLSSIWWFYNKSFSLNSEQNNRQAYQVLSRSPTTHRVDSLIKLRSWRPFISCNLECCFTLKYQKDYQSKHMNSGFWLELRFIRSNRFSDFEDYVTKSTFVSKFYKFDLPQDVVVSDSMLYVRLRLWRKNRKQLHISSGKPKYLRTKKVAISPTYRHNLLLWKNCDIDDIRSFPHHLIFSMYQYCGDISARNLRLSMTWKTHLIERKRSCIL